VVDKVMVKRTAKVKLFCHISNGKVDLLIHIYSEYPNGMTLKNGEMIIHPFGFFGQGSSVSDYNLSDQLLTCSIFPVTFLSPILNNINKRRTC
jgi:hypothetical protein